MAPTVDPSFIVPEEHRPKIKHNDYYNSSEIPLIDINQLLEGVESANYEQIIEKIGSACEVWGFFQVVGHGVSSELLENVNEKSILFFQQDMQEKSKVRRDVRNAFGYYEGELTKNTRDWKEVFDVTRKRFPNLPDDHPSNQTLDGWNQFPDTPAGFREAVEAYYAATEHLAYILLGAISQSLGLQRDHLFKHFENHSSALRLNYYPACPNPELSLGVSRHKDSSTLTVLVQDEVGGLQVRRKDGEWIGIQPRRDAYVINVGDMIQVWSNDRYKSVEHRVVVNESKARLSFPFFFSPSYETDYAPIPELLREGEKPHYRAINWGEFSRKRSEGNFEDLGEEVQIHHYAIKQ